MKETKSYPAAPITIIPIELWDDEKQDQYIAGRVKLHQDAEYERLTGGSLPFCSDLERWARPSTWAVEKKLDKKHSIEERIGKNVRCEADYCGVARWCEQYEEIRNDGL
jgi:hypothetical protein